ncbi:MAG: 50S ribosomal protein L11 methyltransferase [Chloroflexi bacterium]|nr:50S ribosomal protein L11 methyltransferase [Chloroflexota bacterium]
MKWLELSVRAAAEYAEPLAEVFRRYGQGGVAIHEAGAWDPQGDARSPRAVVVTTYLPVDPTLQSRRAGIDVGVRLISLLHPLGAIQEREVAEEDWEVAWKAHFSAIRIGARLVVSPSWQEYAPAPGEVVVTLDPGMAFGTGHHPTTRMCLEELERRVEPGAQVLDLGTGSGILAIAAAKLRAAQVLALDLDLTAVRVARANVAVNGVGGRVKVAPGSLPHPRIPPSSFDLIVANITTQVLVEKAPALAQASKPSGILIASGVLRASREEMKRALQQVGLRVEGLRHEGDWMALAARREA